jgi:hypothetical protein
MPSLNELQEFKASFHDIGGQRANLAAKGVPFDDLKLPDSEPEPLPTPAETEAAATPAVESAAPADAAEPSETVEPSAGTDLGIDPADGIDFSAFLDAQPDDLPEPPVADIPADDLNPPEELLSNLSEELDAIPPDFPEEPPVTDTGEPPPEFDSLANFDLPAGEPIAADSGAPPLDLDSLDNFDLPEEPLVADSGAPPLDLDSLDNFDLPEEPLVASEEPVATDSGEQPLDLPPEETAAADETAAAGEEAVAADSGEEPLDLGSFDDLDLPPEETAATGEEAAPADSGEEPLDLGSFDDLDLPPEETAAAGEEAAPADSGEQPLDLGNFDDLDLPLEETAAADETAAPADSGEEPLDLGSFDDLDLPPEEAAAAGEEAAPADSGEEPLDLGNFDDLDLPPEETATAGEEAAPADSGEEPLDLGNFDDLDLPPEETAAADETAAPADSSEEPLDLGNFDDLDLPPGETAATGESESGDLDVDNLGDLSFPEETAAADETAAPADSGEEPLDLGSFDDLDFSGETAAAGESETENPDLDNADDLSFPEETADGDEGLDLDNLDDSIFSKEQGPVDAIEDFSFPELDNILKKSEPETTVAAAPKSKSKQRGRGKRPKLESLANDVDEIQLSEDEFEGLQETLSRYPINLRIACEEIIAEQVVSPKQLSELIEHLVWGATAKETAILASRILGRTIIVPKAFEKSTGEALEAEQASFAYIFVHNFLPVLRIFLFIAAVAGSLSYLIYTFVYTPFKAESIYKIGYERIFAGEYQRANERFNEAFNIHRKKDWFYKYAEAFRDERQYIYAEQKYDDLLRYYPRDKKGVLDYANLETYHLRNYAKADNILRWQLLDYAPNDPEGLLAAGDNNLVWGEVEPARYEDARYHYARYLELYGWDAPVVERMMKYFIRTDNLKEVLPLKLWFDNNPKEHLSAESLGELGGYLLDKQLEEVRGVPNEYIEQIGSVREMLLEAIYADQSLPEPHYHLARYYNHLGMAHEERVTLRIANRTFDEAPEGSIRRITYRIDALQRYADVLINDREFFPAEEQLVKGINLYEDAVSRRLISPAPKYGKLYAGLGDLEYFTKIGDMEASLRFYHRSEQLGWAPPEMQYRMGSAYYQLENWRNALEYFFTASSSLPLNRRILFALGNTAFKRGDYFAASGYYNRLLDILDGQRPRLPILLPNDRPEYLELAERLMMAQNNAGVASEMLAAQTGNRNYLTRALAYYAESSRAWDARTRDPLTMIRSGSTPLPFLNSRNALYPQSSYEPQIFIRIDREALETSPWEEVSPLARIEHER